MSSTQDLVNMEDSTSLLKKREPYMERYFMLFLFAAFCFITCGQSVEYIVIDNIMAR